MVISLFVFDLQLNISTNHNYVCQSPTFLLFLFSIKMVMQYFFRTALVTILSFFLIFFCKKNVCGSFAGSTINPDNYRSSLHRKLKADILHKRTSALKVRRLRVSHSATIFFAFLDKKSFFSIGQDIVGSSCSWWGSVWPTV